LVVGSSVVGGFLARDMSSQGAMAVFFMMMMMMMLMEGLGELWEAQGQLWEALAELREALGELWEALGELWEGLGIISPPTSGICIYAAIPLRALPSLRYVLSLRGGEPPLLYIYGSYD